MVDLSKATCDRCKEEVSKMDVKYVLKSDGHRMSLCPACRTKVVEGVEKFKSAPQKAPVEKKYSSSDNYKVPYMCTRCNYKFKYDTSGHALLRCPYCGKNDKLSEIKPESASSILENAHD